MAVDESIWNKLKREWDRTPAHQKWTALGLFILGAAGTAYAVSQGREEKTASGSRSDDETSNSDTEFSFDAGYNRGTYDGFWGNFYNDSNYARDDDAYSHGYNQGYQDGQSKDSV